MNDFSRFLFGVYRVIYPETSILCGGVLTVTAVRCQLITNGFQYTVSGLLRFEERRKYAQLLKAPESLNQGFDWLWTLEPILPRRDTTFYMQAVRFRRQTVREAQEDGLRVTFHMLKSFLYEFEKS